MSKPTALSIGIARGGLEIKQFMRQRESVVFTMLFPLILLAIFGSVFSNSIAKGVTFSQYFVAGMIASGMVNTGFQQLAIMIPVAFLVLTLLLPSFSDVVQRALESPFELIRAGLLVKP
jgi:ABC-2 type transport system permease protein